tara:strand:+ start:277 stop:1305 length:1029 start_codon:yes stop_codon:yes gene_type:complete
VTSQSNTPLDADSGAATAVPAADDSAISVGADIAEADNAPSDAEADSPAVPGEAADDSSADLSDLTTESDAEPATLDAALTTDESANILWNGELESLTSADWFLSGVAAPLRDTLINGIRAKHKNLEGGFTRKTQALAADRKQLASREAGLESELAKYKLWMNTGEDLGSQALREADTLRQELSDVQAAQKQAAVALRAELETEFTGRITPVEQERKALLSELKETRRVAAEQESARNEETLDGLTRWIDAKAPTLWEDDNMEALALLTHLLQSGTTADPNVALQMVGGVHNSFNAGAPDALPAAIDVMNNDSTASFDNGLGEPSAESYEDAKRRLQKEARR